MNKSVYKYLPKSLRPVPGDRMRGRRVRKRVTNIVMVAVLSLIVAFVITRQTGSAGFSPSAPVSAKTLSTRTSIEIPDIAEAAANAPVSAASDEPADAYKLETGPFAVTEVSTIALHDSSRDKDLHLRVFYPVASGRYPVIIFSHGAGGSQNCCEALTRHWATYGYITVQPTHDDSVAGRHNNGDETIRFSQAVREALKNPALWESRPRDISFLLDSLTDLEKRITGLTGKIDAQRIGVAGHSMGSYTAEAIGGALIDLPGRVDTSFADTRVRAVLSLSPQGPGQFGLTTHSFSKISLPFMGITGSLDNLGPLANAAWHKAPFERSPAGDKFELFIEGANHMSFITDETANPAQSSKASAILGYTNSASLAFWDSYLKNDPGAKKFLQSDNLERYSHGTAKLSRR